MLLLWMSRCHHVPPESALSAAQGNEQGSRPKRPTPVAPWEAGFSFPGGGGGQ